MAALAAGGRELLLLAQSNAEAMPDAAAFAALSVIGPCQDDDA